jgi:hypothetical protein
MREKRIEQLCAQLFRAENAGVIETVAAQLQEEINSYAGTQTAIKPLLLNVPPTAKRITRHNDPRARGFLKRRASEIPARQMFFPAPLCGVAVFRNPLLFFTFQHLIELHYKCRQLVRVLLGAGLRREQAPITRLWLWGHGEPPF